jgi:hypothetical protein
MVRTPDGLIMDSNPPMLTNGNRRENESLVLLNGTRIMTTLPASTLALAKMAREMEADIIVLC